MTGYFRVDIEMPLDGEGVSEEEFINAIEKTILDTLSATDVEIYDYAIYDDDFESYPQDAF